MTEETEFTAKTYVVVGIKSRFGKPDMGYVELHACSEVDGVWTRDETDAATFDAKRQITSAIRVGCIYSIETNGQQFKVRAAKFINLWPDREQRQVWIAASRSVETAQQTQKQRDKMLAEDRSLETILQPLRDQYVKCRTIDEKMAFEVLVLSMLRRGL
jgi:hypothetical protein